MDNILSIIGLVLGGGGVGFYFNYLINNRKTDQDEFKLLIETWRLDNERLRQRELDNSNKIDKLHEELTNLKTKMVMLESAHFDLPLPQWLKDTDGTVLSVNLEYENTFLLPLKLKATDYIGRRDVDVWGIELANEFNATDRKVMRSKKPQHLTEKVRDSGGDLISYEVFKYPVYSGKIIIGVAGIVLKQTHENS